MIREEAQIRNARFSAFINGSDVRITLKPGQRLGHYSHQRTEEGWASESIVWRHEGSVVTMEANSSAVDCDGRFDRHYDAECAIADLQSRTVKGGELFPTWTETGSGQRDYAAEAAGY